MVSLKSLAQYCTAILLDMSVLRFRESVLSKKPLEFRALLQYSTCPKDHIFADLLF
jgi:hypothetical protein